MGARKGTIAVRRYRVTDALPAKDLRGKLARGARAHVFVAIDPRSPEVRSHGFVAVDEADDLELSADQLFAIGSDGEELRITMRVDTLKPPSADVRRLVDAEAAAKSDKEGRPISRGERRAMRDEVVRKLRLSTPARTKLVDIVWNLDRGRLFLFSSVKTMTELFIDLFARSFALRIEEEGASRLARKQLGDKLTKVQPVEELHRGFGGLRPLPVPPVEDEDAGTPAGKRQKIDEYGFDA